MLRLACTLFVLVTCLPSLFADQGMASKAKLNEALYSVLETGTNLFNKGDQPGCYRLYQGALMTTWAALDGNPDWQMKIKDGLEKADVQMRYSDKAFTLRKIIDEVRAELGGKPMMDKPLMDKMAKKPLWERLGGEPAVKAVIDDFVARAAGDPKVNFTRKGTAMEWEASSENVAMLKKRLVQLVSAVTGGPMKYEGRDMKTAHRGMKITGDEFDALAADLKATLDKFKVPEAEQKELLTIIASTKKDIVEEKK